LAIINLTRELSQAKSERTHQRDRYEEAVSILQNFRVIMTSNCKNVTEKIEVIHFSFIILQVLKRKRLNSLTTVVSLLREQLKIQSMMWQQGPPKSEAPTTAATADALKV